MSIKRRRITTGDGKTAPIGDAEARSAGKDPVTGRFLPGNRLSSGNPYLREQNRIQAAIRAQLDDATLVEFVRDWIRHARGGKSMYLLSLMERLAGRTADWATEERVRDMEHELERLNRNPDQDGL